MNEKELLEELEKEEKTTPAGNSYFLGLALGFVVPIIALVLFNSSITRNDSLISFINNLISKNILASVISVTVLPNLALFFLFLKLNRVKTVKGILTSTVILAIIVFIAKFAI
jgi:hypothetical protein